MGGNGQNIVGQIVIDFEIGQHGPKRILVPNGVPMATVIGHLELAKKYCVDQLKGQAHSQIVVPGLAKPR